MSCNVEEDKHGLCGFPRIYSLPKALLALQQRRAGLSVYMMMMIAEPLYSISSWAGMMQY